MNDGRSEWVGNANALMRRASAVVFAGLTAAVVAACAIGCESEAPFGISEGVDPSGGSPDAGGLSTKPEDAGDQGDPDAQGSCPTEMQDDVWIDRRLGCVQPGDLFVDSTRLVTGEKQVGTAMRVVQSAYGEDVKRINGGLDRTFAYFLCVRNAPLGLTGQPGSVYVGTDLLRVMKLGGGMALLPAGIFHSSFKVQGAVENEPLVQHVPCDPDVHPLIVDYDTGEVESVNPSALAALSIHDVQP